MINPQRTALGLYKVFSHGRQLVVSVFYDSQLYCCGFVSQLSLMSYQPAAAEAAFSVFTKIAAEIVCPLAARLQTDTVREQLVNLEDHLATEEPDGSLGRWWRPNTEQRDED